MSNPTAPTSSHPTMADAAVHRLHEMIVTGELEGGSHLRLADLSERLGMSQMPVREALRRLESLGFVEVHPHRGAFVRSLTVDDLSDTMRTRILLERAAAELAAEHITSDDIADAQRLLDRHVTLTNAGLDVEAREAHTDFHFRIYRTSGSHWLVNAIQPVWRNSERYRFAAIEDPHPTPHSHAEHQSILDACASGDASAAGEAIQAHLTRAAERMLSNIRRERIA